MSEKDKQLENSKYFKKLLPSEINIKKEDIFYRDKYNEIINYVKAILSDSKNFEFNKYIQPKGTLLINVYPGTDIVDFIKLISSNYYLDYIELYNLENIIHSDNFFKKFEEILENVEKFEEKEISGSDDKRKKLILINEFFRYTTDKSNSFKSPLLEFINYIQNKPNKVNYIENNSILIWLNYNFKEISKISSELFNIFDLFIKIPLLNKFERETVLRNFSEKNPKIVFDISAIVNFTENWEVIDINQLLKVAIFKHFLNVDLNAVSNEITDTIINLIETGEYIPAKTIKPLKIQKSKISSINNIEIVKSSSEIKGTHEEAIVERETIINEIRNERISEFMVNQLYENAASKNYNELLVIIDKLKKKESIEDNDRKLLSKYPFILNDSPGMAQLNLERAKKRVDLLKQAFGK